MPDLRMPNTNVLVISGRLARDPELKYTSSGKAVCEFNIAYQQNKDTAYFFEVQAWEKTAELCGQHLRKGTPVLIQGSIKQEHWEKDGQKRSKTRINAFNVQRLAWDDDANAGGGDKQAAPATAGAGAETEPQDDIPF